MWEGRSGGGCPYARLSYIRRILILISHRVYRPYMKYLHGKSKSRRLGWIPNNRRSNQCSKAEFQGDDTFLDQKHRLLAFDA